MQSLQRIETTLGAVRTSLAEAVASLVECNEQAEVDKILKSVLKLRDGRLVLQCPDPPEHLFDDGGIACTEAQRSRAERLMCLDWRKRWTDHMNTLQKGEDGQAVFRHVDDFLQEIIDEDRRLHEALDPARGLERLRTRLTLSRGDGR